MGNEQSTIMSNKKKVKKNEKREKMGLNIDNNNQVHDIREEYDSAVSRGVAKQRTALLKMNQKQKTMTTKKPLLRKEMIKRVTRRQAETQSQPSTNESNGVLPHSIDRRIESGNSPTHLGNDTKILIYTREPRVVSVLYHETTREGSETEHRDAVVPKVDEVSDTISVTQDDDGSQGHSISESASSQQQQQQQSQQQPKIAFLSKSDTQIQKNDENPMKNDQQNRPVSSIVTKHSIKTVTEMDKQKDDEIDELKERPKSGSIAHVKHAHFDEGMNRTRSKSANNITANRKPRNTTKFKPPSSAKVKLNHTYSVPTIPSNKELDDVNRNRLPPRVQKQLKTQTANNQPKRRSVIDYQAKESDLLGLQIPFYFPMKRRINIKLIPFPGTDDCIKFREFGKKHVVWVQLSPLKLREIQKTCQLYQAEIVFTEGDVKEHYNKQTNSFEKRLIRAQIWSGISQEVEYGDDHIRIMGNFTSSSRGMISYLEFELELRPNYKNIKSADTGEVLFAVGVFSFRDIRSAGSKEFKWQAAVENWMKDFDFLCSSSTSSSSSSLNENDYDF